MKTVSPALQAPVSTLAFSPEAADRRIRPAVMIRIVRYVLADILQSRFVIGYAIGLLAISSGLFSLSDSPVKGLASLLNLVLLIVPLASLMFPAIHLYHAAEFIELMAAQPLRRSVILGSEYIGLVLAMTAAVLIGIGIPVAVWMPEPGGWALCLAAAGLTWAGASLAVLVAVSARDKARGIGIVLLIWLYFALLYDALVLLLMFAFADYPMEQPMLLMMALNPIDLARVAVMLQLDLAALMGYTGALFREFLGAGPGIAAAAGITLLWIGLPLGLAFRRFGRKDL
jgi:Cu-processing system permease protein